MKRMFVIVVLFACGSTRGEPIHGPQREPGDAAPADAAPASCMNAQCGIEPLVRPECDGGTAQVLACERVDGSCAWTFLPCP